MLAGLVGACAHKHGEGLQETDFGLPERRGRSEEKASASSRHAARHADLQVRATSTHRDMLALKERAGARADRRESGPWSTATWKIDRSRPGACRPRAKELPPLALRPPSLEPTPLQTEYERFLGDQTSCADDPRSQSNEEASMRSISTRQVPQHILKATTYHVAATDSLSSPPVGKWLLLRFSSPSQVRRVSIKRPCDALSVR